MCAEAGLCGISPYLFTFSMHLGLGRERITEAGELELEVSHACSGIVELGEPVVWGVTGDGERALLSQHLEAVEDLADAVCGTSTVSEERVVSVPEAVFDAVDGVEPGVEVGFVASREMVEDGVMYVLELERVFEEFPEINRGTPGKFF